MTNIERSTALATPVNARFARVIIGFTVPVLGIAAAQTLYTLPGGGSLISTLETVLGIDALYALLLACTWWFVILPAIFAYGAALASVRIPLRRREIAAWFAIGALAVPLVLLSGIDFNQLVPSLQF